MAFGFHSNDNIFVSGSLGPAPPPAGIIKYDSAGTYQENYTYWGGGIGGYGRGIAIDNSTGDIYLGIQPITGEQDFVLLKANSSGDYQAFQGLRRY